MKKVLQITLGILFLVLSINIYAQQDKEKTVLGKKKFESGNHEDALILFNQALTINPENAEANFMAGRCYVLSTCCKNEAIDKYQKAFELDPTINMKILFYMGDSYHHTNQFEIAIEYYKSYQEELEINRRDFLGVDVDAEIKSTKRRIFECENGKEYFGNPHRIKIENLGAKINSSFEDYAPAISSANDEVYFTSKREGSTGGEKDNDNRYFEDIWYSKFTNNEWIKPVNIGAPLNDNGHNSSISLSPDGKRLYLYSTQNGGDIYFSDKKTDGTWSSSKSFPGINTEFVESSISITSDGKMMFYTSTKPGGLGGKDIYFCQLNTALECVNPPKNLGNKINSEYDDEAPFYDVKNNILYFASKGHKGMGGYDLYESSFIEASNTWTTPLNLGVPVNSTDDDVFMSLTADGQTGYYATYKQDSYGGNDLYRIVAIDKILDEPEPVMDSLNLNATKTLTDTSNSKVTIPETKVSFSSTIVIKITDEKGNPLNAGVELKLKNSSNVLKSGTASNGLINLNHTYNKEQNLYLTVEAKGYFFETIDFVLNATNDKGEKTLVVKLKPAKTMEIRPLKNIYFGFDKSTLTPQSSSEIDKLYNLLKNDPKIHIEIAGHTDFIGSNEYNVGLSQSRADAVRKALIKKGIDPSRVKAIGYGEKHPLATNDDELEGRELNRRTEFIIIPR